MAVVHSPRWYRVADLKPRLSTQLQLRRQHLRGETWYVLSDPVQGRSVRLNAAAYALAARLDGQRTVQQLWERSLAHAEDAATQDEVIDILAQLREAALVHFDRLADFDTLLPHLDKTTRPAGGKSLLAWRISLGNPAILLNRLSALPGVLFSRTALVVWGLAVLLLLALTLQHAPALWAHAQLWLTTPRYALLAVVLFVPIKLVHELAHGLAVRRWGGQVRDAGLTLMMLMPVPYVDASAASSFVQRRHRVVVSAAGMMAELALAAVALPLWLWLDEGLMQDAAFVTLFVAGVSTLMFNGNPLQRLDGYFILTDTLELPNLATRSRAWWLHWLRSHVLRLPGLEPMAVARGEGPWLLAYAPLAWLYLLLIGTLIVTWLGQLSLVLGVLGAVWLVWQMGMRPAIRLLGQLNQAALGQASTARRWHRVMLGGGALLAAVLLVPMPQRTVVQGVVWPVDQAQLRATESGVIEAVLVPNGGTVAAGQVVMRLSNPQLEAAHARQLARVSALEATLYDALPTGSDASGDGRAGNARADLSAAQAELQQINVRLAGLLVQAQASGPIALPQGHDLPGQYVSRGSLVGQVLTDAPPTVRVALPEAQAAELRERGGAVSVWLSSSPQAGRDAHLARDSVGAVARLPSAALSTRRGGDVPTDPRHADDLTPLQPVVLLDVGLVQASGLSTERIGERAWVRFEAGYSPLLWQGLRWLQQQALRRFNPQF